MENCINYFNTKCILEFKKSFIKFSNSVVDFDNIPQYSIKLRNSFFEYFKSDDFKEIYQNFAKELCEYYYLNSNDILFQSNPTPRIFLPGAHGTNWHCDYWYGHGMKSKTVWVPILNDIPGATFNAVKYKNNNINLINYYNEKPYLLSKDFDLFNFEIIQVCPPEGSAAIFDSTVLHGSTKNTSNLSRLSFDFRFTVKDDDTSTKNLSDYLIYRNGKLFKPNLFNSEIKFLKYICGGRGIDTKNQHLFIETACKELGLTITGQEAEIERFDFPMLKFHIDEIINDSSPYTGLVIISKKLLNDETFHLLVASKINVFFVLEQECLYS
jgi:hypothetical protein